MLPEFSAAELVFACRCPMIHPYFHARLAEALRLPAPAPLAQRRTVLYLSRGAGAGAIRNQERRVRGRRGQAGVAWWLGGLLGASNRGLLPSTQHLRRSNATRCCHPRC